MPSVECKSETCCVAKLIDQGGGRNAILQHYWSVAHQTPEPESFYCKEEAIDSQSEDVIQCGEKVPPVVWGDFSSIIRGAYSSCANYENNGNLAIGCLKGPPILFGETGIKTEVNLQLYICDQSTLSNLKSFLDFVLEGNCYGPVSPYLYILSEHSIFAWHIEGCFFHTGSTSPRDGSKAWFLVPSKHVTLVNFFCTKRFNLYVGRAICLNATGRKPDLTHGLQNQQSHVYMVVKDEKELTYTCHSDCTRGPKISEAVNYVKELRFLGGLSNPRGCNFDSEGAAVTCDLLQWSAQDLTLSSSTCRISLPETNGVAHGSTILDCEQLESLQEIEVEEMDLSQIIVETKEELPDHASLKLWKDTAVLCQEGKMKQKRKSLRLSLACPACDKTYAGGIGRLQRLLKHINREHKGQEVVLSKMIDERYNQQQCTKVRKNKCPECSKPLAGSAFHVKMHLQSVHKLKVIPKKNGR